MSTFNLDAGLTAINTILTEEANRIGSDIHRRTLHTSPWIDLTKQSAFPEGMGYQLTTLVYDRAIATQDQAGNTAGVRWTALGTLNANANSFDTTLAGQALKDSATNVQGGRGTGGTDNRSFVQFGKQLKPYSLQRGVIESPRISLEDLRFAAHRQDQLRAVMDILTEVTRNSWEERYRDEYERVVGNRVVAKGVSAEVSTFVTTFEGQVFQGSNAATTNLATANISNALLDKIYFQQIRKGAGSNAYGRENGRPVFGLVISSEASYKLFTESGFREDIRYNNAKVSDLIAPLGIEKSFRGFYHLVDDLAPRFNLSTGTYARVPAYTVANGVAVPNSAYESAQFEVAFVLHPDVCESQIPNPMSGSNGLSFQPAAYRGKFDWKNIPDEIKNPDGTIGFFRGVLASATKPIKTEFGYAIIFDRTSSTAAK
jgi:hypothetical protein